MDGTRVAAISSVLTAVIASLLFSMMPAGATMDTTKAKTEQIEAAATEEGIRPARDGNIAILEEFEAAMAANTVAALELFILRNPDHPLAELARQRITEIE
jgi:hypothetical protein